MRVWLIGAAEDARGFALAGVESRVVGGGRELERALAEAQAASPPVGLVLLGAEAAALAPRLVLEWTARAAPPGLLVLPAAPVGGRHGDPG